jgi:Ulp1 family protease
MFENLMIYTVKLHWYLVVLNAKRREIQILDSLGSSFDHKDLDYVVSK